MPPANKQTDDSQWDSYGDKSKSNDTSNNMEEQNFLRMYSKALAEALRAKDEEEAAERERLKSGNSKTGGTGGIHREKAPPVGSDEEAKLRKRTQTTYIELCYDEPIVSGGDGDCRCLAQALIPKQSIAASKMKDCEKTLALSSRLVDGVLQATSRAGAKAAAAASSTTNTTIVSDTSNQITNDQSNGDNNQEQETMFGSSNVTTSEGYAELSFAIFVEGPYRCIQQSENLQVASSFLGSFTPPDTTHLTGGKLDDPNQSRLAEEAAKSILDGFEKMVLDEEEKKESSDVPLLNEKNGNNSSDGRDDGSSSSSEFFHSNNANGTEKIQNNNDGDDNSMEEVFAAESDPDDFEFESSFEPYAPSSDVRAIFGQKNINSNNDDYADMDDYGFNPLQLSKPNEANQSWAGARQSIRYLLSNLSYGNMSLSSLSNRAWSDRGMSDTLADLAFMLLLENAKESQDGKGGENESLMHQTDGAGEEDIATLWDRPLFLLRDRALDANRGHDALPAYLQLLRAFLAHSEEDVLSILSSSSSGKSTSINSLPPATAVGLSCLATVCSSKEMTCASSARMCGTSMWSVCPREEVKNAVISSLNTLARIVECVRPSKSSFASKRTLNGDDDISSADRPWIRTTVCIIPMIEFLINLRARFDFQPVFEGSGSRNSALSDADAKLILDSGLFRELLSMYTVTGTSSNGPSSATITSTEGIATNDSDENDATKPNAEDVVRKQLLHTIFALSIQSPEMLGRYAIRVPDLAKEVGSTNFLEKNLVDGILWMSLSSSLLESKTDAPPSRLKLRTPSKNTKVAKAPVENISLAERSISGFETMCGSSKAALEFLKHNIQAKEGHSEDDENSKYDESKDALGDFVRFSNCLSNCPHATKIWLDSLGNKQDASQKAKNAVNELRSTLTSMPSFSDGIEIPCTGHKKNDDNDNDDGDDDNNSEDADSADGEVGQKARSLRQKWKDIGTIVASVRSSVKLITLALESHKESAIPQKGVPSFDVSSKTD